MTVAVPAPVAAAPGPYLVAALSPDIYLKSRRTRTSMNRLVRRNLAAGLGPGALIEHHPGNRMRFTADAEDAAGRAARVFGVAAVEHMVPIPFTTVSDLAAGLAALAAHRVTGRTFAVRPKRRGTHKWNSHDLACLTGDLLREAGGTVDLGAPEVTVETHIHDDRAAYVAARIPGPGGLPIGSQDRALTLLSGGIDSPVAAWMVMSRGCPVDFLHFKIDCAQSDHAVAVADLLWRRWGAGSAPVVHVVDLRPAVEALVAAVRPKMRQVALKALMMRAASEVASEEHIGALVTGESLGQVSSQTLAHLVAITAEADVAVLRPLVALPKAEIVRRARRIDTFDLSARAKEVCDLSSGLPVEVAARPRQVSTAADRVTDDLWRDAVTKRHRFLLSDWAPGMTTDG